MIFKPQSIINSDGSFIFSGAIDALSHSCLNKTIIKEFWHSFSFNCSELKVTESNEFIFSVGNAKKLPLDGYAYSINVEKDGICVCAESERDLIHGFMTLLDRFNATDDGISVDCCTIKDKPLIKNRMVHFCIFPETEIWELERFVRFCGALKYTHIILEFWGMLRYDCLKELSWSFAFSKEQIRPIISVAHDLGLEVIPMFNHWGHASASRVIHGKHVVLDQDPSLQTYFSEDGWCWDIRKDKVKALLRSIRNELIELCGEGSYFHIGCDEAYNFEFTKENMDFICNFINEIADEMNEKDRRIIAWGDMFLYKHPHYDPANNYACNAPSAEVEKYMLAHLDKRVIIADWQYTCPKAPVETASVFKNAGFDCLLCPWDTGRPHTKAAIETVRSQELMGFIHTTWHTLSRGIPYVLLAAVGDFDASCGNSPTRTYAASLLRKAAPVNGDYRKAGWSKSQIDFLW